MTQLTIDPEFRDKVPKMAETEFRQLEENILKDGRVKVPLTVWNGTIVDGHNRYAIIQKHPEIKWEIEEVQFADRYEAIVWICKNQLGRRNLTEEQKSYLRGKQYEAEKMAIPNPDGINQHMEVSGQNVRQPKTRREQQDGTAGRIGKQYGVNGRTIRRDADFAKGVDTAEKAVPGVRESILSGKSKVPKTVIAEIPTMEPEKQQEVIRAIQEGTPIKRPSSNPAGYPKKQRELNQTINKVVASMYDTERVVEHTADDLLEDLNAIINDFTSKAKRSLQNYSTVLQEEGAKEKAIAALLEAEAAIRKIRGLLL